MKKFIKYFSFILAGIVILCILSFVWGRSLKNSVRQDLCTELREYCKKHRLCDTYCIVVDFSIYSGKERLFIVDLANNRIDMSGLCSHGVGENFDCIFFPKFSNKDGSNYSSLGHYKLGKKRKTREYNLRSVELHGLDNTNSNALKRGILIHEGLPDVCVIGLPCLPSLGCFTVSGDLYKVICNLTDDVDKPVLLYATNKSVF